MPWQPLVELMAKLDRLERYGTLYLSTMLRPQGDCRPQSDAVQMARKYYWHMQNKCVLLILNLNYVHAFD
jgi:hypothetical protein